MEGDMVFIKDQYDIGGDQKSAVEELNKCQCQDKNPDWCSTYWYWYCGHGNVDYCKKTCGACSST